MKTRTDLLNHLAKKYNLHRYLEIGVQVGSINFDKVKCKYKIGVDPDPKADAIFCMTSDEYFKQQHENNHVFDLIFIDGLHTYEQVEKDVFNSLKILAKGGFIVIHDCNPLKEEHTIVPRPTATGHWNGSVYQFAATLRGDFRKHTVDIDNGCCVISNVSNGTPVTMFHGPNIPWAHFNENRKKLLNLISWNEFISIDSHV